MRVHHLLAVILISFYQYGVQCEIQFTLSQNADTWSKASANCKSILGTLAILDNVQLQQRFDQDVRPSAGEFIWVGRYVGYTKVVTIDGCYRNQTLGVRKTRMLVNNYLVTCMRECGNMPYIGLQGQMCNCMDRLPTQAVPVPGTFCQTPCPGEQPGTRGSYLSQCGNADPRFNAVSIYRRIREGEIAFDKNSPNIGECVAYNSITSQWIPQDCSQSKLFTCDAKQCPGPAPMCVLESNVPDTWYNARGKCDVSGAHLATVNVSTNAYFQQKVVVGDPLFWTGLHRKEVVSWKYDENLRYLDVSDRCFGVSRTTGGTWEWKMDWCRNEHRYACVQDIRNTPRPSTTSQKITTPTPFTTPPTRRPTTQEPYFTTTDNPFAESVGVTSGSTSLLGRGVSELMVTCLTLVTSLPILTLLVI